MDRSDGEDHVEDERTVTKTTDKTNVPRFRWPRSMIAGHKQTDEDDDGRRSERDGKLTGERQKQMEMSGCSFCVCSSLPSLHFLFN